MEPLQPVLRKAYKTMNIRAYRCHQAGAARGRRAPADGDREGRPAKSRPLVRADQPAAHEGTDALLAGAVAAGARRFVAQSFAGWPYARVGGWVKTEEDPWTTTRRGTRNEPWRPSSTSSRR